MGDSWQSFLLDMSRRIVRWVGILILHTVWRPKISSLISKEKENYYRDLQIWVIIIGEQECAPPMTLLTLKLMQTADSKACFSEIKEIER